MQRRAFLQTALAGLFGGALASMTRAQEAAAPFSFQTVVDRARALSAQPFQRPAMTLTEPFANLSYDAFRAIRPREDMRLLSQAQGFQVDPLPPGQFQDRVEIALVEGGLATPVAFSTRFFDFHPNYFPYPDGRAPEGLAADLGFSGFRVRHELNRPGVWDETLVFQGASYFRAVARDTLYGLSARGLAIGTGGPTEEFPLFTAFWIEQPAPGAATLTLYALLDSDSVAGAYSFRVTPGAETVMEIEARLFPRADLNAVGVAPLTSMYYFGPESRVGVDDFRDAVHDSGALRMINGLGERLIRPLRNPRKLEVSAFVDQTPRSFGLIQRFRDFAHYQDAEARYELRPSAWVEPQGDWGRGAVILIEIPTGDEFADNIVAFWRPEAPLTAGSEHALAYRLVWGQSPGESLPLAAIFATRSGRSIHQSSERSFAVDFDLGRMDAADLTPRLTTTAGEVHGLSLVSLPGERNLGRAAFSLAPGDAAQAEFRLGLYDGDRQVSELWLYRWSA
jgi:glucans biosynthesis protein